MRILVGIAVAAAAAAGAAEQAAGSGADSTPHPAVAEPLAGAPLLEHPEHPSARFHRITVGAESDGGVAYLALVPSAAAPEGGRPLLVCLHGGGAGGAEAAERYAMGVLLPWALKHRDGPWVVIAPIAPEHVPEAWRQDRNHRTVIDAVRDAHARFDIDGQRVHLLGVSMGASGVADVLSRTPEAFASFSAIAGVYDDSVPLPRLTATPVLVVQGGEESSGRKRLHDRFIAELRAAGAKVTDLRVPDQGHNIAFERYENRLLALLANSASAASFDWAEYRERIVPGDEVDEVDE